MAWTDLTYSFGSLLTSTKMTQNQANFLALAAGDSGAPTIVGSNVSGLYGSWISRNFETNYFASMDGIITCYRRHSTQVTELTGYTDGNATPTTLRVFDQSGTNEYTTLTMPTRKGDYYRVSVPTSASGATITEAYFFLPVGI